MAAHNDFGKEGEEIAENFLKNKGYQILERNYRYDRAEIDIIALEKSTLCFIEVKARKAFKGEFPEEAVSKAQEKRIAKAAQDFIKKKEWEKEVRFDIISIIEDREIKHFKDAFFPIQD